MCEAAVAAVDDARAISSTMLPPHFHRGLPKLYDHWP